MNLIYTVGGGGGWGGGSGGDGSFYLDFWGTGRRGGERVDVFGLDGVLGWVGKEKREEEE